MDEYFERLEIKEGKPLDVKRVYVASDDAKVLSECRRKFPGKKKIISIMSSDLPLRLIRKKSLSAINKPHNLMHNTKIKDNSVIIYINK